MKVVKFRNKSWGAYVNDIYTYVKVTVPQIFFDANPPKLRCLILMPNYR